MPAFIRTPKDESRWEEAKQAAGKERSEADGDVYWGLVNHIYQKMKKSEFANSGPEAVLQRLELIKDIAEVLVKAQGDDDEEVQDYGMGKDIDPEDLEGLQVTDDPFENQDDEAAMWLREHGEKVPSKEVDSDKEGSEEVKPRSSGYSDWKAHGQYTPEQSAKMKEHVGSGYSEREAERMAGAHRGPKDFQSALKHTVKPSQPSPKMLEELKGLASHWLDRSDRHSKMSADPEKNPQKFAAGKMMQAHEAHSKDFNKDYSEFLNSDKVKGMKGMERHKAIQGWKKDWKDKNPEYSQNVGAVSDTQKHYKEAGEARKKNVDEALAHIVTGGHSPDSMSAAEAAQHVGGVKEDEGYSATTFKDPSASFAEKNKGFVQMKQQASDAAAAPQAPKKDPMIIVRRKANPEQLDRFTRVQAARHAQGVGKKPAGEE